ncbi:MAG: carboxyl transferase domain-containing protein [Thermodesulfobacteriota bacterium]
MDWKPEIEELKYRRELASRMGGKEGIERQRKRGKLTVRERIDKLADPGSFMEIGGLAGTAFYEGDRLVDFTPANMVIGTCAVDGRKVVVSGGDFTVRGGAADASVGNKHGFANQLPLKYRIPYIRLLDATGGSVRTFEQIGRTYIPMNLGTYTIEELLCTSPVVALALGSVAGLPAVEVCLSHFSVMVKGISHVFAGGPPVVKAAQGKTISKEDLGDERTQVFQGGVVDNLAESEEEAFEMARRFLSYLPQSVYEMPPRKESGDDPHRRDEALLSVIPRNRKRTYDPYRVINLVLDQNSFFELTPFYGRSRITGLARVNGYPVGVMVNNPNFLGGSMDVTAGTKVIRFIQLCNTFHLPMVYFADEPGFMVGLEAQKQGIVRAGAKMVCATQQSRIPWISIIIRQIYGVAGQCHDRGMRGLFKRVAWPSANWGSMHIEGGASAAYRREIDSAEDPEAKRREIERRLQAIASPFRTAEAFNIEDIIDPRETRPILCDFMELAQPILRTQLVPTPGPSYQP